MLLEFFLKRLMAPDLNANQTNSSAKSSGVLRYLLSVGFVLSLPLMVAPLASAQQSPTLSQDPESPEEPRVPLVESGVSQPELAAPPEAGISIPQAVPYILGSGDNIQIDIFDVPEFSGADGQYTILVDGSINLPWVGRVVLEGLTLDQAADVVTQSYVRFINDPLVTVTLLNPRTLRVGIVGEVNRPGVYNFEPEGGVDIGGVEFGGNAQDFTVTQAIQAAGGITQLANVRELELVRRNPNGVETSIPLDLWSFLQTGDLQQDAVLRDGDTLVVPRAVAVTPEEAAQLAVANFSPDIITVNVIGEVDQPGPVEVAPNTTLNQAILAAGGFDDPRALRGHVELLRLNSDGTISKRSVSVDFEDDLNEETNPPMRNNDVIIVRRNALSSTADLLQLITGPVGDIFTILGIFGEIDEVFEDIDDLFD